MNDTTVSGTVLFDELEAAGVEYVIAIAKNPVLEAAAASLRAEARTQPETCGMSARVFGIATNLGTERP